MKKKMIILFYCLYIEKDKINRINIIIYQKKWLQFWK